MEVRPLRRVELHPKLGPCERGATGKERRERFVNVRGVLKAIDPPSVV